MMISKMMRMMNTIKIKIKIIKTVVKTIIMMMMIKVRKKTPVMIIKVIAMNSTL